MKIWHAVTSGKSAMALSGPLGALMCAVTGQDMHDVLMNGGGRFDLEDRKAGYAVSAIALSAKVTKADGWVQMAEVHAFEDLLGLDADVMRDVVRIFDEAKNSPEGVDVFARQFADLFGDAPGPKEIMIGALLHIVHIDKNIHNAELDVVRKIAGLCGMDDADMDRLIATHLPWRQGQVHHDVLGVSRYAKPQQIEQAFNVLMSNSDVDALNAQGVPIEFRPVIEERVARIVSAKEALDQLFATTQKG